MPSTPQENPPLNAITKCSTKTENLLPYWRVIQNEPLQQISFNDL